MEFFRVRGRKVLGKRLRRKEMFIPYCATDEVSVSHTQVKKDNTVEVHVEAENEGRGSSKFLNCKLNIKSLECEVYSLQGQREEILA